MQGKEKKETTAKGRGGGTYCCHRRARAGKEEGDRLPRTKRVHSYHRVRGRGWGEEERVARSSPGRTTTDLKRVDKSIKRLRGTYSWGEG